MFTNRELFRYAGPIALSSIGAVVVGLTDTVIIGHFSDAALAGVALGASIYELPANALLGGLMAYRILQPRLAGQAETNRSLAGLVITLRGLLPWALLAFAVLLVCALTLVWTGRSIPDSITAQAGFYLLGRAPSVLIEVATSALAITLVSWGRVKVPLTVFLISAGVNVLLDFPLVYGFGPVPRWGAFGDGLASSVGVLLVVPWLVHRIRAMGDAAVATDSIAVGQFAGWKRLALPAVGSASLDYAGNIAFTALIALGGVAGLAGARVATSTHLLAFVLVSSLSAASLYVIGRMHDADPTFAIRERRAIRLRFVAISMGLGAVLALLAWPIALASSPDDDVRRTAAALTCVVAVMCPVIGWAYANVSVLRAVGRTGSDFASNVTAVWAAQVPVAAAGLWLCGAVGAFFGLFAYWVCRATLSQIQVSRLSSLGATRQ